MDAIVMAAMAADRHTELLRAAEQHRRARLARTPHTPRHRILGSAVPPGMGRRWQRLVSVLTPAQRTTPDTCCT